MSGAPDGVADLLRTARAALRAEVLPAVPAAHRYTAAMVANALAIAARELEHGPAAREELLALHARLDGGAAAGAPLAELDRRLARRIRAGEFDDARADRLRAVLLARTRARLRVSNPDYLQAAGGEPSPGA